MLIFTALLTIAVVHAAHPTGTFTLDYVKGNVTTSLRQCGSQMYSTVNEPGNNDFNFELINAMNGDRDSVSFRSTQDKTMYIQVVSTTGEPNRLGLSHFNATDLNGVSFKVVGGLSSPIMFSFKAFTGEFIALTHQLKGSCASKYAAPDSDVALVQLKDLQDPASATWRLMVPTKK